MGDYLKIYSTLTPQELRQLRYREKYKEHDPNWDDSIVLLCKLFKNMMRPGMDVLDAGCGHGNAIVDEFREDIRKAVGIDAEQEATSKNVCLDEIVIGDLEKMPFQNGSFHAVISLWVFEHIHDPERVFSEIFRVLKPGGAMLFVTPYKFSYVLLAKLVCGSRVTRVFLKYLYGRVEEDCFNTEYKANTPHDLLRLLCAAGFEEQTLVANPDPSYFAFNDFFFNIALLLEKLARYLPWNLTTMHLVGVFRKPDA